MDKIKVLIVEDEVLIAEDLKDMVQSFGCNRIRMAHDKKSALSFLDLFQPDIVLLDIRMDNELDGVEIGKHINEHNRVPFIFITAHSDVDMIRKIVSIKPSGYITKPFKKSDLFANLNIVLEQLRNNSRQQLLALKNGYETVFIDRSHIDFIQSDGNYITIHHNGKQTTLRESLELVSRELNDDSFFRVHRSFIVNINRVGKYSKKDLTVGDALIPVSRNIFPVFEERMRER